MADRLLNLQQQIALLPAAVPDSLLDFLEDFNQPAPLTSEAARDAFDPEYLQKQNEVLTAELLALRTEMGKLQKLHVEQMGREIPGAFLLRLGFEKGEKGVGILTKLKERTILRLLLQPGAFAEAPLKELLKNPPPLG